MSDVVQFAFPGARHVAILSDTHGIVDADVLRGIADAEIIVHAGDIGSGEVLLVLQAIAPTVAVRGNNDTPGKWPAADHDALDDLPDAASIALDGGALAVVHGHQWPRVATRHARLRAIFGEARCVAYGHSHRLAIDDGGAPWVVNPGAAGRTRTFGGATWLGLSATPGAWRIAHSAFG